ncbi:MarR family winged helix-turn-helix transcriptional regulator [Enterococcus sp. LJL128]
MIDVLRDIGLIYRSLDAIANVEFREFNLTRGQYLYLVRIVENPGIIQDRLADLIKVDRTTVARAVSKLEANALIEKQLDEKNKKIKKLFPTVKGEKIAAIIIKENQYSNQIALEGLSAAERIQLSQLLEKVKKNVANDWEQLKQGQKRNYL